MQSSDPSGPGDATGKFILMDRRDNVLICVSDAFAGETALVDGQRIQLWNDVRLGHKIARRDVTAGEKIIRYGSSIGYATVDVAMAEHVHSHNLASDYIPAHGRAGANGKEQGS